MKFKTLFIVITTLLSSNVLAETAEIDLPSMLVNADFRSGLAQETPISLTTIDSELIESRGAQHIEDILNLAPNVNVSSGASRGQYFQIRGIGERSQFAAPINPSVGLIIDDIDFSRTGGAATLFDIEQVEILRGPQGTRYGTNALAGIITMQSKQPSDELEIHIETGIAEYNTRGLGVAVGGPLIDDKLLGRFSIYTHQSDGYIDNEFLNRDNTQDRDEITARGKLKWLINDDLTVDLNILHLDINNGYDAFTFDNSRDTLTDDPGQDKQRTNAFALKTDWRASDAVQLQSTITYVKSNIVYSYDADWGFDGKFAAGLFPYVGFEEFKRDRKNYSVELRALSNENGLVFNNSTEWVVGLYYLDQDEDLDQNSDFGAFGVTLLKNEYNTKNTAVFGQLDTHLDDKLTLISGLRVEYFEADYQDSNALEIDTSEVLFGGKLGLNYQASDDQLLYTSLSRGYKSGGVNTDASITPSQRDFNTEYLWSLESGLKSSWLDGALNTNLAVFYALRRDAQVKSSLQVGPKFIDYQANAAKGKNIGIEANLDWLINHQWRVFAAVGLLDATFDEYDNPDLLADGIKISGRRQAHAPAYQFNLGGEFHFAQNWTFRANIEGKDEFYFSNSHNEKSSSYAIVNSSIDYQTGDWKVTLWGKNLFDKDYATRGFFFGNDPSIGYADRNYTQKGDPRVVGLSVSYDY
jgi:outer membrane receptor protein involved in Fe transport